MTELPISKLRMDGGTQSRDIIQDSVVDNYASEMKRGVEFPPVDVFYDGKNYWLGDGFYRVRATSWRGLERIQCEIHQGAQEDAQWYSFSVNQSHGLPRTNEDKARAVRGALQHPKGRGMSNRQIGKHVGVDEGTVRRWREKLELTAEVPQSPLRASRDGRTINTSGIGKGKTHKISLGGRRSLEIPIEEPKPPSQTTLKRNEVTNLELAFMSYAGHLTELTEWLSVNKRQYSQAKLELKLGTEALQPIIERVEKQVIADDPNNRSRLHIKKEEEEAL